MGPDSRDVKVRSIRSNFERFNAREFTRVNVSYSSPSPSSIRLHRLVHILIYVGEGNRGGNGNTLCDKVPPEFLCILSGEIVSPDK